MEKDIAAPAGLELGGLGFCWALQYNFARENNDLQCSSSALKVSDSSDELTETASV